MQNFHFHTPRNVEEALELLSRYGADARPFAGGTALVNLMKQSLVFAEHIVSLQNISDLRSIALSDGELHIGALVTHTEVYASHIVKEHSPLLSEAYGKVATVRIRNIATVGGGLAHADPAQDPPPALIVSGVKVRLASVRGERVLPVEDLFSDYYETAIRHDEIIAELIVPATSDATHGVYLKFLPRTADDYATVGVAALARLTDGRFSDVRVALNAVAPTPVRANAVEDALTGMPVNQDLIVEAAQLVHQYLNPLDDFRGSSEYKREMAVVFTQRALRQVSRLT